MRITKVIGIGLIAFFLNDLINSKEVDRPASLVEYSGPDEFSQFSYQYRGPEPRDLTPYYNYLAYLDGLPPLRIDRTLPVVRTVYGTINLQTYHRNCNCQMCIYLRSLKAQYLSDYDRQEAAQQPTSAQTINNITNVLENNGFGENKVLADLGCGDGRILIAASKRFGSKGIGIEIDPVMANRAKQNIQNAGLSDRITILVGDVRDFDPVSWNVDVVTAYLYPELLKELSAELSSVNIVITPHHKVEGLNQTNHNDLWVYKRSM
jgi:precorrin-6B methylase 2